MKAVRFEFTVGVKPGYEPCNPPGVDDAVARRMVASAWIRHAEKVYEEMGVFVTGVALPSLCLYSTNWGCPVAGEVGVTVIGVRNPKFVDSEVTFRLALEEVCYRVKQEFKQKTAYLNYTEVEFLYFDGCMVNHG